MEPVKVYERENGYRIEIYQDEICESPRTMYDNLGEMVCFHRRYALGDQHNCSIGEAKKIALSDEYIVLPLFLYDHSGLTMNTKGFSCTWDSGQVGYIWVTKEKIREEYGWKRITKARKEQIEKYLKGEVETYDNHLTGNVYGYKVIDPITEEEIDSCWGFFGDYEKSGILEDAQSNIDYQLKNEGIQTELELA